MSGGLPPFTAVSTFCSASSLLTYRVCTFCPGCCASYSEIRCAKTFPSVAWYPSQIVIVADVPALDPLLASVPQPASAMVTAVAALTSPARAARRRCLAMVMPYSARDVPAAPRMSSIVQPYLVDLQYLARKLEQWNTSEL